jgi:hypothetical protein
VAAVKRMLEMEGKNEKRNIWWIIWN